MLEAANLTKRYGDKTAVANLNLRIEKGEIYALLGPNGAGKTTTISLFLGFAEPDTGLALIGGVDAQANPLETKRKLAYIPERVSLYDHLTGIENLSYFTALSGRGSLGTDELSAMLADAGLQIDAHNQRVETYSKGMRQKVGVALALAKGAEALLLDEPTSGLDPAASFEFAEVLRSLAERGVAVLMATHDLFRAQEVATRIGLMRDGVLVRELTRDELADADLQSLYLDHMQEAT